MRGLSEGTEVAVAGGVCDGAFAPFRIRPEEVEMVEVGSPGTHSRRRIFHILGQNAAGRAGNLLVSELYGDGGCWSGYPPHKHDTDDPPNESQLEELYLYRFARPSGFALQRVYTPDRSLDEAIVARDLDLVLVPRGYHVVGEIGRAHV